MTKPIVAHSPKAEAPEAAADGLFSSEKFQDSKFRQPLNLLQPRSQQTHKQHMHAAVAGHAHNLEQDKHH